MRRGGGHVDAVRRWACEWFEAVGVWMAMWGMAGMRESGRGETSHHTAHGSASRSPAHTGTHTRRAGLPSSEPPSEGVAPPARGSGLWPAADMRRRPRGIGESSAASPYLWSAPPRQAGAHIARQVCISEAGHK